MNVGAAFISAALDDSKLQSGFKRARQDTDAFAKGAESSFDRLKTASGRVSEGVRKIFDGAVIGAGIKLFESATNIVGKLAGGVKAAVLGLNNEAEQASTKINAFTKDTAKTAEILAAVRKEASQTPFAFQEMANATAALIPVAKSAGIGYMDLLKNAEILAASNPMQGLEGASFALREAMTGDFTSIIERFNLSRTTINKLKEEGVPNLEIVRRAMLEMGFDADLVGGMALTMEGRWSTLLDSLDGFKIAATKPTFDFLKGALTDLQGGVDGNTDAITALLTSWGEWVGGSLQTGWDVLKRLPSALQQMRESFMGVASASSSLGKADWADRLAGKIGIVGTKWRELQDIASTTKLTVESLFSALTAGDFKGGAFAEDSPLVLGLLRVNELADKATDKLNGAVDAGKKKADESGIALPTIPNMPSLSQVGVGAGAAVGAAGLVAMLPMLGHLAAGITPLLSLVPALGGVLGALVSPIGLVVGAMALLAVAWSQNWFDIQGKTAAGIDAVKGQLAKLSPFIESDVKPALATGMASLGSAWDGFSTNVLIAWDKLVIGVTPFVSRLVGYLRDDLGPQVQGFVSAAVPALQSMGETAGNAFRSILPYVQAFIGAILDIGASVLPIVGRIGGIIVDSLGPAISAIMSFATETAPMIADAFRSVLGIVTPILTAILSNVTGFLSGVAGFISSHSELIVSVLRGAWDIITGIVTVAFSVLTGTFQTVLALLSGDWGRAWDEMKQMLSGVWDGIKLIVTGAFDTIKGLLTLFLDAVKTAWGGAWDWVSTKATDITGAIASTVGGWADGLKTKIETVFGSVKSLILSPFEGARDAIGGIAQAFSDKMKAPIQGALTAMGNFGKGVAGVMRWIAGALKVDIKIGDPEIPQLSKGTNNWKGGWAWVGEGPGGAGAELAYLPQGAKVLPHRESVKVARELGIERPTSGALPGFALGLNIPSLSDIFGKGKDWLLDRALEATGLAGVALPGVEGAAAAMFSQVKGWIGNWLTDFMRKALPVSPDQIQQMITFAESQAGLPYIWGGGHGGAGGPGVGFDCSGYVKAILDAGGIPNPGGIVTAFYEWMKEGRTGVVDIGIANPYAAPDVQHTGIGLMGKWFEAGGIRGNVGPTADYFPIVGHPPAFPDKAKSPGTDLSKIDMLKSLQNMKRGNVIGQWGKVFGAGGTIDEPIMGIGMDSGIQYLMGEIGKEFVVPENLLGELAAYFQEAMMTGNLNNDHLRAFPLEMRDAIRKVAESGMIEARTRRANAANAAPTTTGYTKGTPPTKGPMTAPGYDPRVGPAAPNTRGLNNDPFPEVTPPKVEPPKVEPQTGTKGGGVATLVLKIEDRHVVLKGVEIVREITSERIALEELTAGVTEIQVQHLEAIGAGGEKGPGGNVMNSNGGL